ncbi:hypothetical protein [Actinocorallia libanotica]|uniref:Uncharacterized protein n=1 Tax=Actinocorallia libanotica TaxID=46162 RepID=A0ABN1RPF6_9ACTN
MRAPAQGTSPLRRILVGIGERSPVGEMNGLNENREVTAVGHLLQVPSETADGFGCSAARLFDDHCGLVIDQSVQPVQ